MMSQDMPGSTFNASVEIQVPEPFNLSEILRYLNRSQTECLFHVEDGKIFRMIDVDNQNVIIEISGHDAGLTLLFPEGAPPQKSVQTAAYAYVQDWLDLDRDLQPFYRQMKTCPLLKNLTQTLHGLRIVGIPDLFEALCWAIIGQQINLPFAYTLKRQFVETYGVSRHWNGRRFWLFPKPDAIAKLNVDDLTQLQFTKRKSEYLIGVARKFADGTLSKASLLKLEDFKAAERELTSIRGIGPWTANYVLMRCLRDPSAFPIQDVGLQNAVKRRLGWGRKPTEKELRDMAVLWTGWEAYATFYLWQSAKLFQ